MKKTMKQILMLMTLAFGAVTTMTADAGEKPRVVGALFYSDWCLSCKLLDPRIENVKRQFADESVLFTRFDVTDAASKKQASLLASQLQLEGVYEANAANTGYMLLIDTSSGEVLRKLTRDFSEVELAAAIRDVLDC